MTPPTPHISSTEKALKIMMAFTPHNHPMGTLELSKFFEKAKQTYSSVAYQIDAVLIVHVHNYPLLHINESKNINHIILPNEVVFKHW